MPHPKTILILLCIAAIFTSQSLWAGKNIVKKIPNGAIKAKKLSDGAVTTVKLADGAVTAAKLAEGAVSLESLPAAIVEVPAEITELKQRIAALEQLVESQHAAMQAMLGCIHPESDSMELVFDGCNLHLRNGSGASDGKNSSGNLIIGYNEDPAGNLPRGGSHNLIIGGGHSFDANTGVVAGTATTRLSLQDEQLELLADDLVVSSKNDIRIESQQGDLEIDIKTGKTILESASSSEIKVGMSTLSLLPAKLELDSFQIEADGATSVSINAQSLTLDAASSLNLNGALTRINNGNRPATALGDPIVNNVILPGTNQTVLIP